MPAWFLSGLMALLTLLTGPPDEVRRFVEVRPTGEVVVGKTQRVESPLPGVKAVSAWSADRVNVPEEAAGWLKKVGLPGLPASLVFLLPFLLLGMVSGGVNVKALSWKLFTLPLTFLVYFAVNSEGMCVLVPPLGRRIYTLALPWVYKMRDSPWAKKLTIAHAISTVVLAVSFYLWLSLLRRVMNGLGGGSVWSRFSLCLSIAIVLLDGLIFLLGVSESGSWGGGITFNAVLGTALYLATLIGVAAIATELSQ